MSWSKNLKKAFDINTIVTITGYSLAVSGYVFKSALGLEKIEAVLLSFGITVLTAHCAFLLHENDKKKNMKLEKEEMRRQFDDFSEKLDDFSKITEKAIQKNISEAFNCSLVGNTYEAMNSMIKLLKNEPLAGVNNTHFSTVDLAEAMKAYDKDQWEEYLLCIYDLLNKKKFIGMIFILKIQKKDHKLY